MAEETKETEGTLAFSTADELSTFLMDLQGQIVNIQETVDKLAPVKEEAADEETEETEEATDEEVSEDELSEIDALLQSN